MRYDHAWSYFPEQTVGPVRFFPTAVTYPRTTGVEGYHDLWPRGGVAVRRVRHRQDVGQGELRTLSRGGAERRVLHRAQPDRAPVDHDDAHVDRRRPRLGRRLQPQEPGGAGPGDDRRRGRLRRQRERQLRDAGLRFDARPGAAVGVGRALGRLAVGRVGAAGSAPACRGRSGISAPVAGQLARHRQPRAVGRRSHRVRRHDADRLAAAQRRRRSARRSLQRDAGGSAAAERQLPDAVVEHRRLDAGRQLAQPERHGADAQRPDAAGRVQHWHDTATTTAT